jgi:hypothetical protein
MYAALLIGKLLKMNDPFNTVCPEGLFFEIPSPEPTLAMNRFNFILIPLPISFPGHPPAVLHQLLFR